MIEISQVSVDDLVGADYNPRQIDDRGLRDLCRSLVEFGLVDPVIARREDRLVVGGHQRLRAVKMLLAGQYREAGRVVAFELPGGKVPVVYVDGLDDARAKQLNLALNKISGEWDYGKLGQLMQEITVGGTLTDLPIGFSEAEIVDLLDVYQAAGSELGVMPSPTTKAPALALDFSSAALRDAVKAHLAGKAVEGKLSGDLLADLLGVVVTVARPRRSRRREAAAS